MRPNDKTNIIKLTLREHFIAHLILWKCYGQKMAHAFHLLTVTKIKKHLTSRQFETLRKEFRESLIGHPVSEYTKQRASETHKGKTIPEWHKKRISEAGKGRVLSL